MYIKQLPVGVAKGTLIDLETTGLDSCLYEIITLGVVVGNKLKILQRKSK